MWGLERRMQMNLRLRIETPLGRHQNRKLPARAGRSTEATYLLAVRCPVYRGRDSSLGFRTELENLVCDGKGKGTSGSPVRPKVPTRKPRANCFVVRAEQHVVQEG